MSGKGLTLARYRACALWLDALDAQARYHAWRWFDALRLARYRAPSDGEG